MNPLDLGAIALLVAGVLLGVRSGALPQVGGLIGAGIGAVAGLKAIPLVLPQLDPVGIPLRVGAVLLILLLGVGIGEFLGGRLGRTASGLLGDGLLGALDRVAGGIVGIGQVALIVWLVGGILATGLIPSLNRNAQTSLVVRGLAAILPPPTELVLELGKALDRTGLPDVFLGLERPPAEAVDLPADRVAQALGLQALGSVPRVEAEACGYRSTGTGVVIAGGYVVTNAHVVAGSRAITVVGRDGALDAVLVLIDPELDVALLHVPGLPAGPLIFATASPERGAVGATIGYPSGGGAIIEPAAVTATYVAEGLDTAGTTKVTRTIIEIRAVVDPGDSGGPLLLTDGTIGGLVFAESRTDDQVGYALAPTAVAIAITPGLARTAPVPSGACLH